MTTLTQEVGSRNTFDIGLNANTLWHTVKYNSEFEDFVLKELDQLRKLPPDWDQYGAKPIDTAILDAARDFIKGLDYPVARPSVVPLSSGSVQFEWHVDGRELELEVESPYQLHYLKWHPATQTEEEDVYSIDDYDRTVELLSWLSRGRDA